MPSKISRAVRRHAAWLFGVLCFAACLWLAAGQEPEPRQRVFVGLLMLCTALVLVCTCGRVAFGLICAGIAFVALRQVSLLKMDYLETPLMPADFVWYLRSSLLDTLLRYPHFWGAGIALCVLLPPILWLLWRRDLRLRDIGPLAATRPRARALARVAGIAVAVGGFWLCMLPAGPFAVEHARSAWEKLSDDAVLTNFFVSFDDARVVPPTTADDTVAERDWQATANGRPGSGQPYPDIVEVLEESTFDPNDFDACVGEPLCRAPALFENDATTRGHGFLRVHTFGGGTWVSEFAALTGLPHDIFGPGGVYAPFVLAPHIRDSLPLLLRRLGYLTVAVYPTNGDFLNGRNAYRYYGVDRFFDSNELKMDEWEQSDTQMFQAAKAVYDQVKKPGQPVFLMILTINQHGPHNIDPRQTLPPPFNHPVLKGLDADSGFNFDTYLSRLRDSDRGMALLQKDFLDRAQPTVLVHFGDHQPSFDGLIQPLKRRLPPALVPERDLLTYYTIKSNVSGPMLPTYPALDIAYLPTMVLQAAGLPLDAYFDAETELRQRCDGRFEACPQPGLLDSYYGWIFNRLHVYQ